MAPMRWQGGDKAPSRKSSLLCRLILNWPDPLTGTGTLNMRHTHRQWQQTTDWSQTEVCFSKKKKKNIHTESKSECPSIPTIMSNYNYIQAIGTFHVLNWKEVLLSRTIVTLSDWELQIKIQRLMLEKTGSTFGSSQQKLQAWSFQEEHGKNKTWSS